MFEVAKVNTKRRSQADRTTETCALLVEAANVLLSERGYGRATTAEIARHAGVTTGALHHHFPTKESLFFALLDDATEQAVAQFRNLSEDRADASCTAEKLIDALWSLYGSRKYWAVWEINIGFRSDAGLYDRIVAHRRQTMARIEEAIAGNVSLSDRTRRVLLELLPFILSAMRGIFLDGVMRYDEIYLESQRSILASMLRRELDAGPAPGRAGGSRRRGA
jgi:AcrR family transcriptional regulator